MCKRLLFENLVDQSPKAEGVSRRMIRLMTKHVTKALRATVGVGSRWGYQPNQTTGESAYQVSMPRQPMRTSTKVIDYRLL